MKANNTTLHHVDLKRIYIYLAIVFGVYYGLWFIAVILPSNAGKGIYSLLSFPAVFMGTPAFAVFITRKITSDKSPLKFSAKVWKNKKALLFSAFVPTAAIFCGTAIFFLIFPNDLDFSGKYISQTYGAFGAPSDISFTVFSMLRMGTIVYIISAVCFPVWFIALGGRYWVARLFVTIIVQEISCQMCCSPKWCFVGNGTRTIDLFWHELWQ